jgi:hypothetical protein
LPGRAVWQDVSEVAVEIGLIGTKDVAHPCGTLMTEWRQRPDTPDPRPVEGDEVGRVVVETAEVWLCRDSYVELDDVSRTQLSALG